MKKVTIKSFKGTGTPDGNNVLNNIFDGKPDTRYSVKGKGNSIELDIDPNDTFNGILIAMYKGDVRTNNLTFSYSEDNGSIWHPTTFQTVEKTSPQFIRFPKRKTGVNKLKITFNGNSQNNDWFSVVGLEIIDDEEPDMNIPEPNKPDPEPDKPTPTDPVTGRKVKNVVYPPPRLDAKKGEDERSVPFNKEIASKNEGKSLNIPLPLLTKVDKNGVPYANIPKLLELTGFTELAKSKDYNYNNEKLEVYENNNSEGESKRFDFRNCYMPQFEVTIWLNNESGSTSDEESLKDGGPHSDSINYQADCTIVQLKNTGKTAVSQLEPSHMDSDPHGYGDKFNNASLDLPELPGNPHSVRFIRINDLDNNRVIIFAVVKFDKGSKYTDWTVVYQTIIYGGYGGDRGLKDPFCQWVGSSGISKDKCSITVRMDKQPKTNIKKGTHYKNARCTEIIDYE